MHPQKNPLTSWLMYQQSPFVRPPQSIIDAGLVYQTHTGAWTVTKEGREVSGQRVLVTTPRGG